MHGLVVYQLSKRVHILSFKFTFSQHWEKQDLTQKYISEMVAREKIIFIFVVFQWKRFLFYWIYKNILKSWFLAEITHWDQMLPIFWLECHFKGNEACGFEQHFLSVSVPSCACFQTSFSWILHVKKRSAITTHHSIPKIAQRLLFKETRWPSLNVYVLLWGLFISVSSQPYWHFGVLRGK